MTALRTITRVQDADDVVTPVDAQVLTWNAAAFRFIFTPTGGSSVQGFWRLSLSTVMADPGAGKLRFNTATPPTATALAVDVLTDPGTDVTNLLRSLGAGDSVYIQDQDNAANWIRYDIGAAADNSGWFQLTVALHAAGSFGGVLPSNNASLLLVFDRGGGGGGGAVSSVFTRTGAVVAQTGDYTAAQVTNAAAVNAANTFTVGPQTFQSSAPTAPFGSGTNNERFGAGAGSNAATASNNVVLGQGAGTGITSGGNNVVIGQGAGTTTGGNTGQVIIGQGAMTGAVAGGNNVAIGVGANAPGGSCVAIGGSTTTGSGANNVIIGATSTGGGSSNSVTIGFNSTLSGSVGSVVSIGANNIVSISNAGTLGTNNTVSHQWSWVIGSFASSLFAGEFAMCARINTQPTVTLRANPSTGDANPNQIQGAVAGSWADATYASRKGRLALQAYDATAAREGLRIESNG